MHYHLYVSQRVFLRVPTNTIRSCFGLIRRFSCLIVACGYFSLVGLLSVADAQVDPLDYPLADISQLQYEGAFRLPAATYGSSSMNYSEGPLEYNPDNHSIYIVGHTHHQQIAEFSVPALVNSSVLSDLSFADPPIQSFAPVLSRVDNPQNINRIGGLEYVVGPNGPELLVNGYEYYDADGGASHTTLVMRDADDLASTAVDGYFRLPGGAHASGWMSPLPFDWHSLVSGTHLTGHSSGIPIISRTSVGPSAFAFDPLDIAGVQDVVDPIVTQRLLDYSLKNPLHSDLSNSTLTNDLWTHLSRATFGYVIPGTRTYLVLGSSGGHDSGVCYKCTQDTGRVCGGYCSKIAADNYPYYWAYDMLDLLYVSQELVLPWEVRPYDYGVFAHPFGGAFIGGGSYDPASELLYLTAQRADREQGRYSNPPVVMAFRFGSGGTPTPSPSATVEPSATPSLSPGPSSPPSPSPEPSATPSASMTPEPSTTPSASLSPSSSPSPAPSIDPLPALAVSGIDLELHKRGRDYQGIAQVVVFESLAGDTVKNALVRVEWLLNGSTIGSDSASTTGQGTARLESPKRAFDSGDVLTVVVRAVEKPGLSYDENANVVSQKSIEVP